MAQTISLSDLSGWPGDDHMAALAAYVAGLPVLDPAIWPAPSSGIAAREFFETAFRPVLLIDDTAPLFTGYFEPELAGSLTADARFCHPLYRQPAAPLPLPPRARIEAGALAGQGLELVWVDDPVALYFLQVQGSGRILLPDGTALRVGYAGRNGHPYLSLGRDLIARGLFAPQDMTADALAVWLRADPERGVQAMNRNPSYVFFRPLDLAPDLGPLGTLQVPLTPHRSCAVDPAFTPLGAPVWVETADISRLMAAQDTGGAIKGAQRADLYFGTGAQAGLDAGRLASPGRMITLLPLAR